MTTAASTAHVIFGLARAFAEDRRGATAIEYSLIASLIAMAIVGAISATGDGLSSKWDVMSNKAINAMTGG